MKGGVSGRLAVLPDGALRPGVRASRVHAAHGKAQFRLAHAGGVAAEEVTRTIYLAPVADLQIRSLLVQEEPQGVGELLAQIARCSARVLDVTVDE